MSASEQDIQNNAENDETLRLINQVKFDIRDEVAAVTENGRHVDSSDNEKYEEWMEDVREVRDQLEDLLRVGSRDSMLDEAERIIKDKVIEPYIENLAGNGPHIPGYGVDETLESEDEAIISSGELEATYMDDIENLYAAVHRVSANEELNKPEFVDYKRTASYSGL